MAGIQIDGVNNKIDFDDDADTSISSATDDTLVIESGGVNIASITAGEFVINEGSADIDFRVESNGNANMLVVDGADDDVRIGTATNFGPHDAGLKVKGDITIGDFTNDSISATLGFIKSRNTTVGSQTIVADDDEIGRIAFRADDGNDANYNNNVAAISVQIDAAPGTDDTGGRILFETTADGARTTTERMRIANTGNVSIGNTDTTPALGVTVADTRVTSGACLDVHHTKSDTTFSGILGRFQSARNTSNPDDYEFIRCAISGVANKLFVHATGTVDNATGSYGTISDERIKQNIVDANSQWDDIKALKFKNFKKKANVRDFGDDALKELGVIAQDLEAAGMNGLVQELKPDPSHIYSDSSFGTVWTEDDDEVKNGTETVGEVKEVKAKVKTVKYSILYMKAVKALQEAMARIETLETKVAALEGN